MVTRAAITQEQVSAVADRLQAAGTRPTARAVRDALGGGAMTTILRFLKMWQGKPAGPAKVSPVLPAGLQQALVEVIQQEIASAVEALGEARLDAREGDCIGRGSSNRRVASIQDLEDQVERLRAEKAELFGRFTQLNVELEQARKHLEDARQATVSARTEQARLSLQVEAIPRLEGQIHQLHSALEAAQHARSASEQAATVAAAKLELTEAQVAELQGRLAKTEQDLPQMRASAVPRMSAPAT